MEKFEKRLFVSGVTILVAFVATWLVLQNAHYHTAVREVAMSASNVASFMVLVWVVAAGVFAVLRWRTTSLAFRLTLGANLGVTTLLVADFLRFRT